MVKPIISPEVHARRLALSARLTHEMARAWGNLSRLLDQPSESDEVALDVQRRPDDIGAGDTADDDRLTGADAIMTISQLRAGRALARLGMRELASVAGVSTTTIPVPGIWTDPEPAATIARKTAGSPGSSRRPVRCRRLASTCERRSASRTTSRRAVSVADRSVIC